jgi:ribosomal protein S18 acetylase RimI-like enzyme
MQARLAERADVNEVLRLVSELLLELGGKALDPATATGVYDALISQPELGFVVLGEEKGSARAVCTVSFVHALRSSGRYAIVQEMYVEPQLRSSGIGRQVLEQPSRSPAARLPFIELETPYDGTRQIQFYLRSGFVSIGERLRLTLR